jgi:hypothetical protein
VRSAAFQPGSRGRLRATAALTLGVLLSLTLLLPPGIAAAQDAPINPEVGPWRTPHRDVATAVEVDGQRFAGDITGFDARALELTERTGGVHRIRWQALPAARIWQLHRALLAPDDGLGYLRLALLLQRIEDDDRYAEQALTRALRAEPELLETVQALRAGQPLDPAVWAGELEPEPEPAPPPAEATEELGSDLSDGAVMEGLPQHAFWGTLSDEVQAQSVEELREFAVEAQQTMQKRLALYETQYFLFYTDLDPREARRWAQLLDRMYHRMIEMFGLEPGVNIFRGKCLVFVFREAVDYRRFQITVHGTDPGMSAGMCHSFGNGYNHVAFYRQERDEEFAHVLVHETSHAFIHRYRSPVHIPVWLNEGLAEAVATELAPGGWGRRAMTQANRVMRETHSMFGFLHAQSLQPWQYGLAQHVTLLLYEQSGPRYAALINAIKDGKTWQEALVQDYGITEAQLVEGVRRRMNLQELSPF